MANEFDKQKIKAIKDAFEGNHETLEQLRETDSDLAEESFEQGYENGIRFTCKSLGIDLESEED